MLTKCRSPPAGVLVVDLTLVVGPLRLTYDLTMGRAFRSVMDLQRILEPYLAQVCDLRFKNENESLRLG